MLSEELSEEPSSCLLCSVLSVESELAEFVSVPEVSEEALSCTDEPELSEQEVKHPRITAAAVNAVSVFLSISVRLSVYVFILLQALFGIHALCRYVYLKISVSAAKLVYHLLFTAGLCHFYIICELVKASEICSLYLSHLHFF